MCSSLTFWLSFIANDGWLPGCHCHDVVFVWLLSVLCCQCWGKTGIKCPMGKRTMAPIRILSLLQTDCASLLFVTNCVRHEFTLIGGNAILWHDIFPILLAAVSTAAPRPMLVLALHWLVLIPGSPNPNPKVPLCSTVKLTAHVTQRGMLAIRKSMLMSCFHFTPWWTFPQSTEFIA